MIVSKPASYLWRRNSSNQLPPFLPPSVRPSVPPSLPLPISASPPPFAPSLPPPPGLVATTPSKPKRQPFEVAGVSPSAPAPPSPSALAAPRARTFVTSTFKNTEFKPQPQPQLWLKSPLPQRAAGTALQAVPQRAPGGGGRAWSAADDAADTFALKFLHRSLEATTPRLRLGWRGRKEGVRREGGGSLSEQPCHLFVTAISRKRAVADRGVPTAQDAARKGLEATAED